jgi:hypothetical protein
MHTQKEKTVEELKNELDNLQIMYSRMFLATSLKGILHDIYMQIQELKNELKKRTNS